MFIPNILTETFESYDLTDFIVTVYDGRIYLEWNDLKEGYTENRLISTTARVREMLASGLDMQASFLETCNSLNRTFVHKCQYEGKTVDGESYKDALSDLSDYFGL